MAICLDDVTRLQQTAIREGDRWIFVADFNIKHADGKLKSTDRVDAEVDDLRYILNGGGVPVILAHKGRFKDGDTENLGFIVPHLAMQLGVEVNYFPENTTADAARFVLTLAQGSVAIMGNTRTHQGEEKNDPYLAAQFAGLGRYVAVGGFGKAHRAHASNVGILAYLPGCAAESQLREMALLAPWAGSSQEMYSVAVLGGAKKEKITTGLAGFAETYDALIPGGIVLNTILKARGLSIGDSLVEDGGKTYEKDVAAVMDGANGRKVLMPDHVVIARSRDGGFLDAKTVRVEDGVPDGYMIVDFVLPPGAVSSLERMAEEGGRLVLAGTPGIYTAGFKEATDPIVARMMRNKGHCIVLGGDTSAEVGYDGPASTGGGSALHFVAYGTTPVFEALKANKEKFRSGLFNLPGRARQ